MNPDTIVLVRKFGSVKGLSLAEEHLPSEDRRRPARPPWLLSGDVQPRVSSSPSPQQDEADAHDPPAYPPYPPTKASQDDYRWQGDGLIGDRVAPDHQQTFVDDGPMHEPFQIGTPHGPGQPVHSMREPLNPAQLSGVVGHEFSNADTEPELFSVGETADYLRDAVTEESSSFGTSNEQAPLATRHDLIAAIVF